MSPRLTNDQKKGTWDIEEDKKLISVVERLGPKNWTAIAANIPGRTAKSCRVRWQNQLSPEIKKLPWSASEDALLIK